LPDDRGRETVHTVAYALAIVVIAVYVASLFTINVLKGKLGFAFAGFIGVLNVLWWIGAIRLAKPSSWWARRYYVGDQEDKLERAIARHGDPAGRERSC
jgi:hypothetical protein